MTSDPVPQDVVPEDAVSEGVVPAGSVAKRSVRIAGHPTSVSLEPAFWEALKDIAAVRGQSLNALVTEVDEVRVLSAGGEGNLSSALRVWALEWYRRQM